LETGRWAARGGHSPEKGETTGSRTPCTPPRQRSTLRVILGRTPHQAEHALHAVRLIRQQWTRPLHPTKTRLVGMAPAGFDVLGCQFQTRRAKRTGTLLPDRWPSQKARKAIRRDIHARTSRQRWAAGLAAVISRRNLVMAGGRNDVQSGHRTMKLPQLDRDVWHRVRRLVRAKRGSRGHGQEPGFAAWMQGRGVVAF
jgi:hypothetical protein